MKEGLTTEKQISIFDVMQGDKKAEVQTVEIPAPDESRRVYRIPADVWETRCAICVHKNGPENIPCDIWIIERPMYAELIPCRIMRLFRDDVPGECHNFTLRHDVKGTCKSCRHNNQFHDGYCMKEDHATKRRVYGLGNTYNCPHPDYYSDHILSVCDDYLEG